MAETHVIHALRQKRAQVSGELIKAERLVSKLQGDLVHIDAVMRVFDPTIKPRQIKPKVIRQASTVFKRGEFSRTMMDVLRGATAPMSPRDIASQIAAERRMDVSDKGAMDLLLAKMRTALGRQKPSVLTREVMSDGVQLWRVA